MPIIIQSKEVIKGTAKPSDLGEEVVLIEIPDQEDDYIVEGYIDLSQMLTGDEVTIIELIAVDGLTQQPYCIATFVDKQTEPVVRLHTKTIRKDGKYKVVLRQDKGTLREFSYYFIKLNYGSI